MTVDLSGITEGRDNFSSSLAGFGFVGSKLLFFSTRREDDREEDVGGGDTDLVECGGDRTTGGEDFSAAESTFDSAGRFGGDL